MHLENLLQQVEAAKAELRLSRGGREKSLRQQSLCAALEALVKAYCDAALEQVLAGDVAWSGRWLFSSPTTSQLDAALKLAKMAEATAAGPMLQAVEDERMLCAERAVDIPTRQTMKLKAVYNRVLVSSILAVCYFYMPRRARMAMGYSTAACEALASCCPANPEELLPCAMRAGIGRAERLVSIFSSHGTILAALGKVEEALAYGQIAVSMAKSLKDTAFVDRVQQGSSFRVPCAGGDSSAMTDTTDGGGNSPSLLALWSSRSASLLCSLTLFNVSHILRLMRSLSHHIPPSASSSSSSSSRRLVEMERETLVACRLYGTVDLERSDPFLAMVESRLHEVLRVCEHEEDKEAPARIRIHRTDPMRPVSHWKTEGRQNVTLQYLRGATGLLNQQRAMRRAASANGLRVQPVPLSRFSSWLDE